MAPPGDVDSHVATARTTTQSSPRGENEETVPDSRGDKALLEMEYNTGSAWIEGHKVCSATASRPPGAEEAGPGWVNTPLIAKLARVTQDALEKTVPAQGGDQLRHPRA